MGSKILGVMGMWGKAALAVAGWLAMGGAAAAQDAPAFPESLERESLLLWLQRETDITSDRVVAVTPQALTAVVSTFPAGGGQGPRAVIRAEALSHETYARTGALSWHVSLNADCQGRRVRLGETTGYAKRNLLGERKLLRPAEADWRTPERGTALDNAWRAACEADFKGPFAAKSVKMAQPDGAPPPAKTSPAPVQKAPPPAPKTSPAPPPRSAAPAPRRAGMVAQVGASPSDVDARRLLASLGTAIDGRDAWVEKAVVGGRTWHRAVVGGFADAADAGGFCASLKASGRGCFVRAGQ